MQKATFACFLKATPGEALTDRPQGVMKENGLVFCKIGVLSLCLFFVVNMHRGSSSYISLTFYHLHICTVYMDIAKAPLVWHG